MRYANDYGFYELNPFPGCAQLVVSNNVFVHDKYRGQGIGGAEHKNQLAEIRRLGYDCAICTCRENNHAQIKILEKNNWKRVHVFHSRVSGNDVGIWINGEL